MTGMAPISGYLRNERLKSAFQRHGALSSKGLSERLFGLLFSGLVYPQIWEDPDVDMAAMEIEPHHNIVTIGSGGCNMLAYLSAGPARIDVVDLNHHHIALNKLKLAAFRTLPSHSDVVRMFSGANVRTNKIAFDRFIAPFLDEDTLNYWNGRNWHGRRRVAVFNGNIYRTGLLGRFISTGHIVAKLHGKNISHFMQASTMEEQNALFDQHVAPLFDRKSIRWITGRKSSLFGLGIPPQQYDELAQDARDGHLVNELRARLRRLACDFPLQENYFAWQAFARRYPTDGEGPLPSYLKAENYDSIRRSVDRAKIHHANLEELLRTKPDSSVDRYVLLDAQDWMTGEQMTTLWQEIQRTARPGARVIFRTAAAKSPLESKLPPTLLSHWDYDRQRSKELHEQDRSAIYGGFHIYREKS